MNKLFLKIKRKISPEKMCGRVSAENRCAYMGIRILLAYGGGSIKKNGVYEEVIAALEKAGKTIIEFPGIMENPTYKKGA